MVIVSQTLFVYNIWKKTRKKNFTTRYKCQWGGTKSVTHFPRHVKIPLPEWNDTGVTNKPAFLSTLIKGTEQRKTHETHAFVKITSHALYFPSRYIFSCVNAFIFFSCVCKIVNILKGKLPTFCSTVCRGGNTKVTVTWLHPYPT